MLTKKVFRLQSMQPQASFSDKDFEEELKALEAEANAQTAPTLPTFSVKKSPTSPVYATTYTVPSVQPAQQTAKNSDFIAINLGKAEGASSPVDDPPTDAEDQSQPLVSSSSSSQGAGSRNIPSGSREACGEKGCKSGKCSDIVGFAEEAKRLKEEQDAKVDEEFEEMKRDGTLTGYVFRRDYYGLSLRLSQPGVNPNELDARKEHTVLHHACYQQEFPMIQLLLARGANVNARNIRGETPLMWACKTGYIETLRLLVANGADVNAQDDSGLTPLLHAAERGQETCMAFLVHGCNVDICQQDTKQKNALHWASWAGHLSAVQWLISQGCDRNVLDEKNCYAVHWAAAQGHEKVVNALLFYTAKPHHTGDIMVSPMVYAQPLRKIAAAQLAAKNSDGLTPKEFCAKRAAAMDPFLRIPHDSCQRVLTMLEYQLFFENLFCGVTYSISEYVALLGGPISVYFLVMYVCALFSAVNFLDFWVINFTWLKVLFYASSAATLYNWILVVYSDPGTFKLDTEVVFHEDEHNTPSKEAGAVYAADSKAIEMKRINGGQTVAAPKAGKTTYTLHSLYQQLLTKPQNELSPALQREQPNICITCQIVRPVRSKHCPLCNRCVHKFDHHCPFFGTDIAAGNYTAFLQFLVFIIISMICFLGLFCIAVFNMRLGLVHMFVEMKAVTFFHLHYILHLILASLLLGQHIRLLMTNTTTNESMNWTRYSYMKDRYGSFFNPFNLGCYWNYKRVCCWYPLEPATIQYSRVSAIPEFVKENHGICGVDLSLRSENDADEVSDHKVKSFFRERALPGSTDMASPRDRRGGYVTVAANDDETLSADEFV